MDLMDKTYNNKGTTKVKDFQKLSYKEIYFTFQSNSTKYNKPFKFISWSNFLEGHHILSREIWGKAFTGWFKKCQMLCVPDVKNEKSLTPVLYSLASCPKLL